MNWVGGARNRLKVPNERKLQRDYFERKRLATRVSRGQKLNQLKGPISKDLLFLSKAASNAATDDQTKSPTRPALKKVNLDSCGKLPARDLELPMSPIEKPSTLDLMDATVTVNLSLDQSFLHPTNTANLPRVSTMKIPQVPKISDIEDKCADDKAVMNISCMTEALFPVSETTRKQQPIQGNDIRDERREPSKKYSLDDLLDASQIKESFFPLKKQKSKCGQAKPVPRHADELLWSRVGRVMLGDNSRKRSKAQNDFIPPKQKLAKQDTGYNFGEWMAHTKNFKGVASRKSKQETDCEKDMMLEIHYSPEQNKKKLTAKDKKLFPQLQKQPADKPVSEVKKDYKHNTNISSLTLTENPIFDLHHSVTMNSTISEAAHKEEKPNAHSLNSTLWNESIIGPLKKNLKPVNDQRKKKQKISSFERMMSSFEDDQPVMSTIDVEDVIVGLDVVQNLKSNLKPKQNSSLKQNFRWKNFVLGEKPQFKMEVTEQQGEPRALSNHELSKPLTSKKTKINCSVLEELMCLEQESLKGLDACTQELPLSPLDCTEDPIMRRVPDSAARPLCPFDSSQDSSLTVKSLSQLSQAPLSCIHEQSIIIMEEKPDNIVIEVGTEDFNGSLECMPFEDYVSRVPTASVNHLVESGTQTNITRSLKDQEQQTSPKMGPDLSQSSTLIAATQARQAEGQIYENKSTQSDSLALTMIKQTSLKDASVQAGSNGEEVAALTSEIDRLKEELKVAESTIIWQSLMMKIQNIP